jgi:plasmid stabilization system protein ParE
VARVELDEDARRELDEAVTYLNGEWLGRGDRFLEAFRREAERLLVYPRIGTDLRGGLHRWLIRRWGYALIYSIEPYGIFIIAVAHHSRHPNYWSGRLP